MIELNLISKFVGHLLNIKEMRLMDMISLTSLKLIKLQEKKKKQALFKYASWNDQQGCGNHTAFHEGFYELSHGVYLLAFVL